MRSSANSPTRPVGSVLRLGPRGVLVVTVEGQPVAPGTLCATADGRPVGMVVDLIGPVSRPFLVVAPPRKGQARQRGPVGVDPRTLIGTALYAR